MEKVHDTDIFLKKMSKYLKIKDINGNDHVINDINKFISHINKYHLTGVSIHEEDGYFFEINDNLRDKLKNFNKKI